MGERKREEQLRLQGAALEAVADGIAITDVQGNVLWVNPAFCRVTGYAFAEILGQNLRVLKSGKHDQAFYANLWQTLLAGRVWQGEMTNRRKDGTVYIEEQTITPVRNEHREVSHFIAIKQDITDRKQMEEHCGQAQKMEAVGRLAGRVAHDFGNLLTMINGYGALVLSRLPPGDPIRELVKEVIAAGDRAVGLTRQLHSLSRKAIIEPKVLDLNAVLADVDTTSGESVDDLTDLPRGSETVLLVDDEDGVRALTRCVLQDCGYTVLEARGGAEAVRIAEQHQGKIDLLVTDVVMPRMGGAEATERARALHPEIKILFVSGYTDDAVKAEVAFLQKPFTPASLAVKVREVLDSKALPVRSIREQDPECHVLGAGVMPPIRILLVDDHSILRAGIRKILQELPGTEIVAEAGDGREALTMVAEQRPDIVFMDIAMAGMNGLEATSRLSKEFPNVRVIILSAHADEEHVWKALRAGAAGYLLKQAAPAEIALALATVVRGESYITSAISQRIVAEFIRRGGAESSSVELLTSRQREILQLLAEGKNTKEIARMLSISGKTVEAHRAQIMERLDIHDLTGLVRYAVRVGLISA